MIDEKKVKRAKMVYDTLCKVLTDDGWNFKRDDENLVITTGAKGNDLPMDIIFIVDAKLQVISLYSPLQMKVPEDKRVDAAMAVAYVNCRLLNGCFDLDLADGEIRFRMVNSFTESILGEELFKYMTYVSCSAVDAYNEKFFALSSGVCDFGQFIDLCEKADSEE